MVDKFILIACGGRDYRNRDHVFSVLDSIHAHRKIDILIEGGQTGVDTISGEWADDRGVTHVTAHANWIKHGRGAGPRRNGTMLILGANGVVAIAGGIGTKNMVGQAKKAGIKVMEVAGNG